MGNLFRSVLAIVVSIYLPGALGLASGFWTSALTGFVAGIVASGDLKAGLWSAFSAGVFFGIGQGFAAAKAGIQTTLAKTLLHGVAGGIMQAAQGGKFGRGPVAQRCEAQPRKVRAGAQGRAHWNAEQGQRSHGFLSAGVTQFAGERIGKIDPAGAHGRASRIIASALVGGSVSAATGGKFAHGAVTAAFSRGFNDEAHLPEAQEQASPHKSEVEIALGFAAESVIGFGTGVYRGMTLGIGDIDDARWLLGFTPDPPMFDASLADGTNRIGSILGAFSLGGATGLVGKGTKGFEYSHFIPARYLRALGLETFFGRSALNGSYVPRWFHALTDKWRFRFMPRSWKESLPFRVPQGAQQVLRTPPAVSGSIAGAIIDEK